MKKIIFCFLFIFLLSSCTIYYQPNVYSKVQNQYTTFYVGNQGTQYFIKPLVFENAETHSKLYIDYTFRYKKSQNSDTNTLVNCNFTLYSKMAFNKVIQVETEIGESGKAYLTNILDIRNSLLNNGKYESRYSSKLDFYSFNSGFQNEHIVYSIMQDGKWYEFVATKKTQKMISKLNRYLFQLNSIEA